MTIHNNYNAMFAYRQLGIQQSKLAKALQRLSSGYRINSAADDPAGLGISERMRAQITALNRASMNARDGMDLVNTADGALAEVHSMLNRLVDLATHAANGTLQTEDRRRLQEEYKQIVEELDRIAGGTRFGEQNLLDGQTEDGSITLQVGDTGNAYDRISVGLPNLASVADDLRGLSFVSQEAAQKALDKIKTAVGRVSAMRGDMGAMANRLQHTVNVINITAENLTEAESRIRDADMAKEMMNFVRAQVLSQAAQLMMVHAMQQPYRILDLLRAGL